MKQQGEKEKKVRKTDKLTGPVSYNFRQITKSLYYPRLESPVAKTRTLCLATYLTTKLYHNLALKNNNEWEKKDWRRYCPEQRSINALQSAEHFRTLSPQYQATFNQRNSPFGRCNEPSTTYTPVTDVYAG